jgi:hypothetical protein
MSSRPQEQGSDNSAPHKIGAALKRVEGAVGAHYPEALDPVKAALPIVAVGALADNRQPTSLIFVARSGAGKSLVVSLLIPEDDQLRAHLYRCDKLTAAAFVSHRADFTAADLKDVDLLPRIKGKTLLTKELAPIFAGKEHELRERFAMLTSVLDGQGFIGDSGAHGRRGYDMRVNFQWLGATTPLSPEALRVMAQLGPRFMFYDADRPRKSINALTDVLRRGNPTAAFDACHAAVRSYLETFFATYPPGSVSSDAIAIEERSLRVIALWAEVLARLRGQPLFHGVEHAERVAGMLRNFAIGSAVAHGRREVTDYDLAQVAHIALSSGTAGRGKVLRALLARSGSATTTDIDAAAGISAPTAREHMEGLANVGLARFSLGDGRHVGRVELLPPFTELCRAPMLKAKRGEGAPDRDPCELKAKRGEGGDGGAES